MGKQVRIIPELVSVTVRFRIEGGAEGDAYEVEGSPGAIMHGGENWRTDGTLARENPPEASRMHRIHAEVYEAAQASKSLAPFDAEL